MSGLMSAAGKKVLHIDKNDYYGGAAASLTLDQVRVPPSLGELQPRRRGRPRPPTAAPLHEARKGEEELTRSSCHSSSPSSVSPSRVTSSAPSATTTSTSSRSS